MGSSSLAALAGRTLTTPNEQAMLKKIALITALATSAVILAPAAEADAACKSNWMKLTDNFRKLSPIVAKGVCKLMNKPGEDASEDEINEAKEAANKCIEDYEEAKAEIEKIVKVYNEDAGSGKIGPRGLGTNHWYTGKLQAERTFIGMPVMSDEYTVHFKADGGKNKGTYTVEICFVDPNDGGSVTEPITRTFKNNKGEYKKTFKGVYGARPMVYLKTSRPSATKAHRYKLHGREGGEPAAVAVAHEIAEAVVKAPIKGLIKPGKPGFPK